MQTKKTIAKSLFSRNHILEGGGHIAQPDFIVYNRDVYRGDNLYYSIWNIQVRPDK
jgi:hypothetical protein